jgi:uncharacterized protein (DUF433 family)
MKAQPELLARIVVDADVMTGKPVVRGTRLTVQFVLGLLAAGASEGEVLEEYPGLTREDVRACLAFAASALDSSVFVPLSPEAA